MQLTPPSTAVFVIAVILWALAVVGHLTHIDFVSQYDFWVAVIAFVILAVGNIFRGV
jgi:hypothetical protein